MPNRVWRITATGRDASALNGLRIEYVEDPNRLYYLMTAPPHSTIIMRGEGDPPSFADFTLGGNSTRWFVSVNSMTPNPHGTYYNTNNEPNPRADSGSWQSEAVPEPLPASLAEGKEGKEGKESAGAASY